MNPTSRIQKGKELENYVASVIKTIDPTATRQIGSGSGKAKGDIHTNIGWTIECKNTKRFDFYGASEQVKKEAMGYQKEAIIWHPKNRPMSESVVILNIQDFVELLKSGKDNENREEILDKYQIKNNLEKAVYHLKQVIREV